MASEDAHIGRRDFLRSSTLGVGLGLTLSGVPIRESGELPGDTAVSTFDGDGPVLLFQGDSITDAGRSREEQAPNHMPSLGSGYVSLAAGRVLRQYPGHSWQCYNRGISGNKVFQLANRWEMDCLDLAPDVLSILIGVNDFWHTLDGSYDGTVERYERDYRTLLDRTQEALPEVTLILGEPFALRGGKSVNDQWYPKFNEYRKAAKRISEDFETAWIPYQSIFDEAQDRAPASYWAPDGVHPSLAGSTLMAQAWMEAFHSIVEA